jgi:hypothetical protein
MWIGELSGRAPHAAMRALLVMLLLTAGCGSPEPDTPTMPRATFVDVMVELRQAADTLADPEAFNAERDRILARAGVSDSALVAFVRVHGAEPGRMAVIWDTIAARLVREEDRVR